MTRRYTQYDIESIKEAVADAEAIASRLRVELADLREFARRLALALADECAFAGAEAAEASVVVLAEARNKLDLAEEFDKIDTLSQRAYQ